MLNKYSQTLAQPVLRKALPPRKSPYNHNIEVGRSLGYYKPRPGAGYWSGCIRHGHHKGLRKTHTFAFADDLQEADGQDVLTFNQALEKAREWCGRIDQSSLLSPSRFHGLQEEMLVCPYGPVYTVGHALAEYLERKRNHGARQSFLSTLSMINYYVFPLLGTIAVAELTPQHFYDLLRAIESTPTQRFQKDKGQQIDPETLDPEARRKRRVTANHVLCSVRGALNRAWEEGKVGDSRPWQRVQLFRGVQKPRADIMTLQECRLLLRACEPDLFRLVLAALYTGCRVTELASIRAEDLSQDRMAVYIRPLKVYRCRHVALPEEGYAFFKSLTLGKGRSELLFLQSHGRPWKGSRPSIRLNTALERAGLRDTLVFHSLRHTYASLLIQNGVSPIAVARQLGHQGIATVMQTYAHCADDFIDREIREKFEPIIASDAELAEIVAGQTRAGFDEYGSCGASRTAPHLQVV